MSETIETVLKGELRRFKAYPTYKDSGIEWLGEIPADWEVKRLRYVSDSNPVASEVRSLPGDTEVSFVPMEAVGENGGLALETTKLLTDVKAGYTYFRDGDVVIAKITPCFENGKGALADGLTNGIAFGTTELHVLRTKAEADAGFAFYVTLSDAFRKIGEADMYGAGGQKRISETFVRDFRMPLPPLPEQRAIAKFLDGETARIDTLVARKKRLITLLQERRSALITRAVTRGLNPAAPMKDSGVEWLGEIPAHWEVKRVKRLCQVRRGASPRPIDDPVYFDDEGEYAWVRIADVTASERYLERTTQRMSDIGKALSVPLEPGELFVSIAGTVGKPIITRIKCCIHDGFVYFVNLNEHREYLFYVFSCGEPYKGLGKMGTQLNLNTDTIGNIVVPRPPEEEQEDIVSFLDRRASFIDSLIGSVGSAIYRLQELRTALISAAVTGKIDVRETAQ
ncbi:MAG: restriction endonuclease subunit S [Gemmatimonas sp.]|nr:restriction endonuclease subunit S [Gemmatimonas sp.]